MTKLADEALKFNTPKKMTVEEIEHRMRELEVEELEHKDRSEEIQKEKAELVKMMEKVALKDGW